MAKLVRMQRPTRVCEKKSLKTFNLMKEKRLEKPKLKDLVSKCSECCSSNQSFQRKILNELKILNSNFESITEKENIFQFAAMVIDKFCLWIFTVTTLLSFSIFILTIKLS